jgi:cation:H+ antiporter
LALPDHHLIVTVHPQNVARQEGQMTDILLVLGGFIALLFGGDYLVRGAVSFAQRWGVSPMVIGLTLVGFGTSMPELLTSLQAAFAGAPGIAVGNVIGSNIANILLILGAAALIAPITVSRDTFVRDGAVLVAATVLCIALALTGSFSRGNGVVFLIGLGGFLFLALRGGTTDEDLPPATSSRALAAAMFIGGLLVTLLGAKLLVVGAVFTIWPVGLAFPKR